MGILERMSDERVKDVHFSEYEMSVELMDGRTITVPLSWYPRLENASKEKLEKWEICAGGYGLHWEGLDEDLSTEGLLLGVPAPKGQTVCS
jgi:hypothetical protein